MNYSIFRFTLNMHNHRSQVSIPAFKGDTAIRLMISITDGGNTYFIEDGCTARLRAKKPDGKVLNYGCAIENNTRIQFDFTEQTTSCEGIINCELNLYGSDGKLITSPRFIIVVDSRVAPGDSFIDAIEDEAESKTEIDIVDELIKVTATEEARKNAEAERQSAEESRQKAEANRQAIFRNFEDEVVFRDKDGGQAISGGVAFVPGENQTVAVQVQGEMEVVDCEAEDGTISAGLNVHGTVKGAKVISDGDASVGGNLDVDGDLNIKGTTKTVDHETISVQDNILVVNSEGASFSNSGLVINKGDGKCYGILYQPTDDVVCIGEGTLSEDGEFTFDRGEAVPLAARHGTFPSDTIPVWNAATNAFRSSGKTIASIAAPKWKDANYNVGEGVSNYYVPFIVDAVEEFIASYSYPDPEMYYDRMDFPFLHFIRTAYSVDDYDDVRQATWKAQLSGYKYNTDYEDFSNGCMIINGTITCETYYSNESGYSEATFTFDGCSAGLNGDFTMYKGLPISCDDDAHNGSCMHLNPNYITVIKEKKL